MNIFCKVRSGLNRWWLIKWWDKRCLGHDATLVVKVFGDPKKWGVVNFSNPREVELNTTDESQLDGLRLMEKQRA